MKVERKMQNYAMQQAFESRYPFNKEARSTETTNMVYQ